MNTKKGRKCIWTESTVCDLVDIIIENDKYKEKLLLTNVKNVKNSCYYEKVIEEVKERCKEREEEFTFDIPQTRAKFKRCVSSCREAALKIKTSSGIKRFQEEKEFGTWFQKLFPIVSSMDSCQPEQSIEPTRHEPTRHEPEEVDEMEEDVPSSSKTPKRKTLFVPIHETAKRSKSTSIEKTMTMVQESLFELKESFKNDTTSRDLLDFLKADSERQSQRDDMFLKLMANMCNNQQPTNSSQHHANVPHINDQQSHYYQGNPRNRYGMTSVLTPSNITQENSSNIRQENISNIMQENINIYSDNNITSYSQLLKDM